MRYSKTYKKAISGLSILEAIVSTAIVGIGFIATLTAAVSAYFLSNFGDKQTTLEDVLNKLEEIDKELDELREAKNE